MKTLQVQLPDSVHDRLEKLSKQEGVSLNQVLVTAASNELVRQETREFFQRAASEFDPKVFADALAAVPDVEPVAGDEF